MGIKDLKPSKNSKTKQGYFVPNNPQKYKGKMPIIYRSSWEKKVCIWLDNNENVIEWSSESIAIPYILYGSIKTYYPDFYALIKKDGIIEKFIFEVKPKNLLKPPSQPKIKTKKALENYQFQANEYAKNYKKLLSMKEWCSKNGFKYIYLTEEFFKQGN
jgi:hypothetical protein